MTRFLSIALLVGLVGCGGAIPKQKDDAFSYAVEAMQYERHEAGAKAVWNFLAAADRDDPRYDRGLRLLATSLEGQEFYWAASMTYRQIAADRRNVELVPEALRGIMRIVQTGYFDEDSLITSFVAGEEFSDLPPDVRGFVTYYQGLDLARRGIDGWADERFAELDPDSEWGLAVRYVYAVRQVAEGDYPKAIEMLTALSEHENLTEVLRPDVERSLARIAFEEKRYGDALSHYENIRELAPNDPEVLLESAWTYYYMGDSRKALGLLIALDAPVHHSYISPERYLLEALALRRLCQFGSARFAAIRLERRHGEELSLLSQGRLPGQIPGIRHAARQRGLSRGNFKFMVSLAHEWALLEKMGDSLGAGLTAHLKNLYQAGLDESMRREEELIDVELGALTEEMLAAQEGVRLIVHELGVSLLRGRRRPEGVAEKPLVDVPLSGDKAFFTFRGEFWTDELDDLNVIVEDRCID